MCPVKGKEREFCYPPPFQAPGVSRSHGVEGQQFFGFKWLLEWWGVIGSSIPYKLFPSAEDSEAIIERNTSVLQIWAPTIVETMDALKVVLGTRGELNHVW